MGPLRLLRRQFLSLAASAVECVQEFAQASSGQTNNIANGNSQTT
jgi:hypothetical protein